MTKNIVVFSDGTGQEGGEGPDTNIYKLFKICENRTKRQVLFYDRGLGTTAHCSRFVRFLANITGFGISKNLKECYQFIFDNYQAKDKIFLFGFSRGATTVRSLAGFIEMFGILPKSRPELIAKAYRIYQISDPERRKIKAREFREKHHNMWVEIEFLGVWDTVAALGLPWKPLSAAVNKIPGFKHEFHDLTLPPSVKNAYHALSIDDEREVFHPVLWNEATAPNQIMQQTWFAGVHTDVGGGYADARLSDITFKWMLKHAERSGLRIHGGSRKVLSAKLTPDEAGTIHNPREGIFEYIYKVKQRDWPQQDENERARGQPHVHASVFERVNNPEMNYKPWIVDHNPIEEPAIRRTAPVEETETS
ncbi:hypothetical protein GCM10007094_34030 [Pseudovibrio japonicus]|uniref:T6SS Phospholipase effector Tle1-like catalytic domain-containing protein n=1 Tax=Pseudovibrio japonicus TaxID=366534 RepID=A0ABQ3EKV6_9HYPH|nr:DUF2235 domain-containing protein [Pseudovibrio japonicus]GHB42019.1 hypothetical protein GCM10007094_34030 [Pseudovibrio japonicus]